MKLTLHFTLEELVHSETATRLGIDNSLDPLRPEHQPIIENLRNLCTHVLEPLRTFANLHPDPLGHLPFGEVGRGPIPILINSGYRCPALNKAVGGVRNSKHIAGQAADIHLPSIEVGKKWFEYLKTIDHDQLIWETNANGVSWIHVSYSTHGHSTSRMSSKSVV